MPIPNHMDLYHLREEAEPSDRTALEAVVDHIKEEMARLNVCLPVHRVPSHAARSDPPCDRPRRWKRRS